MLLASKSRSVSPVLQNVLIKPQRPSREDWMKAPRRPSAAAPAAAGLNPYSCSSDRQALSHHSTHTRCDGTRNRSAHARLRAPFEYARAVQSRVRSSLSTYLVGHCAMSLEKSAAPFKCVKLPFVTL